MFGIGGFELFIILVFGFLIFGPDKLPEIAKTVGKGIARFREAQQEMNDTLGGEKIFDPNNPDEPFKDPTVVLDKLAQKQEEKRAAKVAGSASATAGKSADADGDAVAAAGGPKQESFTERKARYERERAARKAAEAEAAKGKPAERADAASGETPIGASTRPPAADAAGSAVEKAPREGEPPTDESPAVSDASAIEGGDA